MRLLLWRITVLLFMLVACSPNPDDFTVAYRGSLHQIMRNGDLAVVVALDSLAERRHLYGLGAMAELQGEIILWNGQPIVTSVIDNHFVTSNNFNHKAALLVYAQVPRWREIEIPVDVKDSADLEEFIGKTAKSHDNIVAMPLPFLLQGQVRDVQWHIVNWTPGDTVHTHEKHTMSGLHGRLEDQAVEIVGF